ncbi:MAG: energy-coupling factor transporter transmembrane protein EcfT [Chloroflexi bacterium]|nr:energy-coupling factor transporter transmembrane protein EcfT [Chloroflexota bacterium]
MQTGWFDRLHPLTKLSWAIIVAIAAYITPAPWGAWAMMGVAIATPLTSSQRRSIYRTLLGLFVPIAISLFIIQGLLFPTPGYGQLSLGGMTFELGGFSIASVSLARIVALGSGLLAVIMTTTPSTLAQALAERGMPRSIEYILLMALQILPDMRQRTDAILEAQQARGLVITSLPSRIKALIPLIGPLVVGALIDVEERAMALEQRAFASSTPPTRLHHIDDSRSQHIARTSMWLIVIGLVIARISGVWS